MDILKKYSGPEKRTDYIPAKKKTAKKKKIKITAILSFSTRVRGVFSSCFSPASKEWTLAFLGLIPISPKYLLLKNTNKSCPNSAPIEAAKNP